MNFCIFFGPGSTANAPRDSSAALVLSILTERRAAVQLHWHYQVQLEIWPEPKMAAFQKAKIRNNPTGPRFTKDLTIMLR